MNKYRNVKTEYNGRLFHSKKEAEFARIIDSLRRAKRVEDRVFSYECQKSYAIWINGIKICNYIADFVVKYEDGRVEIIDVKGYKTDMYNLKKKMVEAYYGVKIIEI